MSDFSPTSDSNHTPIIRTIGLTREYHMGRSQVHALQGIHLTIAPGEFIALMGPSGCGKSTLLHLLGCLDTPTSGKYFLEGRDISTLPVRERAHIRNMRIGFVFQNFFLIPSLNAVDNVALPLLYGGGNSQARKLAIEALEMVGLGDRETHRPNELSGGERQRVAIARALVNHPAILLADEPTGALDSATGAELMNLLVSLWKEGLSILLVTHDAQVAGYAQRVVFMKDGQIIREQSNPHRTGEKPHSPLEVPDGQHQEAGHVIP
jgi:putative ABC transport system ATP-binding protein